MYLLAALNKFGYVFNLSLLELNKYEFIVLLGSRPAWITLHWLKQRLNILSAIQIWPQSIADYTEATQAWNDRVQRALIVVVHWENQTLAGAAILHIGKWEFQVKTGMHEL